MTNQSPGSSVEKTDNLLASRIFQVLPGSGPRECKFDGLISPIS